MRAEANRRVMHGAIASQSNVPWPTLETSGPSAVAMSGRPELDRGQLEELHVHVEAQVRIGDGRQHVERGRFVLVAEGRDDAGAREHPWVGGGVDRLVVLPHDPPRLVRVV